MADMPRCKTCKWWDQSYEPPVWTGEDKDPAFGACVLTMSKRNERPIEPFTLAYAVDHEEYEAELMTHEDFGCIQHESDDVQYAEYQEVGDGPS